MKKILPFLMAIALFSIAYSQTYRWTKTYGGASYNLAIASTATDDWGNVYAIGTFGGTVDFDPSAGTDNHTSLTSTDTYVLKFDAAGTFKWAKTIGGSTAVWATSIAIDDFGNVLANGYFLGTADFDPSAGVDNHIAVSNFSSGYVLKLDSLGTFRWARTFGSTINTDCAAIAVDANGNVYSTGLFKGSIDLDPSIGTDNHTTVGVEDVFVQKLDPNGNFVWANTFGGTGNEGGRSISISALGDVLVVGGSNSPSVDFDPSGGTSVHNFTFGYGCFVEKFDAAGNFIWARALDGSVGANSVATDGLDNVYFAGIMMDTVDLDPSGGIDIHPLLGPSDLFVEKLDALGNFVWAKNSGGATSVYGTEAKSLACDPLGNIYLTGIFGGTVDFDPSPATFNLVVSGQFDVFVEKFDSNGGLLWAKSFGGTTIDFGANIAVNALAHVYVGGYFKSNCDFNPDAGIDLMSYVGPNNNAFLWRYDDCNTTNSAISMTSCDFYISPSGNHTWTATGTYLDTIANAGGCDSIMAINLTIIQVDSSVTLSSGTLSAVTTGATYQWIACDSGNAAIPGATNQSFHPVVTGNYAVVVTSGICSDTSACTNVIVVGLENGEFGNATRLFPNPTNGNVTVDFGKTILDVRVDIIDMAGNTVWTMQSENASAAVLQLHDIPQGMYFVKISSEGQEKVLKLVRI